MTGQVPASWEVDPAAAAAYEVVPGLWRLRLPSAWHHVNHVNAYVIPGPDGLTLVDTGSGGHPSTQAALEHALAQAGFGLADVRDLVLTHYHTDHMGLAGPIKARSGCRVWGHPAGEEYFEIIDDPAAAERGRRELSAREGASGALLDVCASVREELEGAEPQDRPDRLLREGDTVPTGLGELSVLHLPGHCPSQIALWHSHHRFLISADAIMSDFVGFCDLGATPDPISAFRSSVERIAHLDPALALPGHGRPISDVARTVARYRNGFAGLTEATSATLRDAPQTAMQITRTISPNGESASAAWQFFMTYAFLLHLEAQGRATHTTTHKVSAWTRA